MRAIVRTKQFKPKPANPQADPRFKNVKNKAEQTAKNLKQHPSAKQKSDEAAKAAKGPPNEKAAGAKANKVDSMKEAKAETPPADNFLTVLRAEIEKVMPATIEDADDFMGGGAEAEMKGAVKGNVKEQKDAASGDLQAATNAPPSEGGVPAKAVSPVPPDPNVPRPALNGGSAMPAPMPDADISQKQTKADAQTAIKENRLDGKRGQNKHPAFDKVKSEKGNVERTADASPGKFRAGEKQTLGKAATQATVIGRSGMASVVSVKNKSKSAVKSRQEAQKQKDEQRRKAVTDHIEKIYNDTKKDVDANLNSLERDVMAIFDSGSSNAIAAFKRNTNRDIDKFYEERYSGVGGKLDWIADKFKDTPPRVKQIIQENLVKFTKSMDDLAVRVAGLVDKRLNKAKSDIASGEAKIKAYVKTLPKDLQAVGKEAEKAMKSRFDEMREGIEAKKNDLAQKLAQKYKEAHDQANELAKKIEEENKGAFKKLADAIGEVIKIIMEFKDKLMALLAKAADAIELILDDPIGFLGNLIGAIKQGVNQFVGNIWTHLKAGFMKWLFGSLADAGIEIPTDLSLVSLFKMVMSVLGLTIPRLRAKAVKMLGPTAVAVIEKLVEYVSALITGGPAKLWEQVKADVGDLKVMIIDAIQDWLITTIIKQATIKLLSFFNPAGAFIQALMAIYNTVMFVIENASKIMAFVEAVINSVSAIAKGAIGAAANWIEQSLASMIPLLIGFLARLIGLGGLSKKVKEFITKVQGKVDKAIDKAIGKIVQTVKKLFGKLTGKDKDKGKKDDKRTEEEKLRDLKAAKREADQILSNDNPSEKKANKKLKPLVSKYKLTSINVVTMDATADVGRYRVKLVINPELETNPVTNRKRLDKIQVAPPFKLKSSLNEKDFMDQLTEQQEVMNSMDVAKWLANRAKFESLKAANKGKKRNPGRDPAGDKAAELVWERETNKFEAEVVSERIAAYKAKGKTEAEARPLAQSFFKKLISKTGKQGPNPFAYPSLVDNVDKKLIINRLYGKSALHRLDQVAGGEATDVKDLGSGREDFSIGKQWSQRRLKSIHDGIDAQKTKYKIKDEELSNVEMNVGLLPPVKVK
ncbi:MAG TPA: polymorphic toxin type 15 domain-containing protein [Pyrinomonadaceae bacterium]|nr:polymorphic toxin type 15 domain-containing protein [Pyrinomonadaceae bacterium]